LSLRITATGALACALLFASTARSASAPDTKRFERRYDLSLNYLLPRDKVANGSVIVDVKMIAKLWTLMGEPVVYCSASWTLRNANLTFTRRGESRVLLRQGMPASVWKDVDLIDAKFAIPLVRKRSGSSPERAWLPCDIGATNANGDPRGSFTVPGSPDWSRLLLTPERFQNVNRPWDDPANYMTAAEAKAFMKSPDTSMETVGRDRDVSNSMVLEMQFNFWSLISWQDDQYAAQEEKRVAERAAERRRVRDMIAAKRPGKAPQTPGDVPKPDNDPLDPFDAMVEEIETTTVNRDAEVRQSATARESSQTAARQEQRRRQLAARGCLGNDTATLDDLDAAAERAEAGHAKCSSGADLWAFRDEKTGLYGYSRRDGSGVQIEPRFTSAKHFSEGLGLVEHPDACGAFVCYVNAVGAVVLRTEYKHAGVFSSGLAFVVDTTTWLYGYIDREGHVVVPLQFSSAETFKNGRAQVWRRLQSCDANNGGVFSVCEISPADARASGLTERREEWPRDCYTTTSSKCP
jgi:hypothetical protein